VAGATQSGARIDVRLLRPMASADLL